MSLPDLFWEFANKRLDLMKTRYTSDTILQKHKFTNCYRACDRVSQYLIKNVILTGDNEPLYTGEDVLLRVLLFKIFNRIDTWEYLQSQWEHYTNGSQEHIDWRSWNSGDVEALMDKRATAGYQIFTGVYRITSKNCYDADSKYGNYLACIDEIMLRSHAILAATCLEDMFWLLCEIPLLGPFLSMQLCTDLGYTGLFPWTENDYIYPGPGCKRGVSKTFGIAFGDVEAIITKVQEVMVEGPERFPGLELRDGTTRPLSLMDVQNLFCEFDKYLRVADPTVEAVGFGSRKVAKRPKQQYSPARDDDGNLRSGMIWPDDYVFPEKWYVT